MVNPASQAIFTIGHSTRKIHEFVALLTQFEIKYLVDVRSFPRSRRNPQFNAPTLRENLRQNGITYLRIEQLGGYRSKRHVPEDVNGFWRHPSFHNYADYALSKAFQKGLKELIHVHCLERTCIMCSEAVWWRCHRRIVTDYLLNAHIPVLHIMGALSAEKAQMTKGAVKAGDKLHYPSRQPSLFTFED